MAKVGIRELKQNASAAVARVSRGEAVTITLRGQPVAELQPVASSYLERLIQAQRARPPRRAFADLPTPDPGPDISATLAAMRDAER